MTPAYKNYLTRLKIELEGLKLSKSTNRKPRSTQEGNQIKNQNERANRKEFLINRIKEIESE